LLLRSESHFLAGLLTGFIVIKLQYAPLIVLVGLILGRLKFLYGLIISSSIFLLATLYVVGWDNIISYPSSLLYGESLQTTGAVIMQNFRGQALLLLITSLFLCTFSLWQPSPMSGALFILS
jgi:hypothetical protein